MLHAFRKKEKTRVVIVCLAKHTHPTRLLCSLSLAVLHSLISLFGLREEAVIGECLEVLS